MTVITLLTDFGLIDGYAGVMKGVIWKIAPHVEIADISHTIKPQDVYHGALVLARTAWFFPPGTIHVAVVDPGVGTRRRPLGLKLGEYYFIGPDNGLFTMVIDYAETRGYSIKVVNLDQSAYWLPEVSKVFHGRDIFAPVAAHLVQGIPLEEMGSEINDPVRIEIPHSVSLPGGGWRGEVIDIDNFGNLVTNIELGHISSLENVYIKIAGSQINGLVNTFGDRPAGTLIALIGTSHDLIVSIVYGNAASTLGASIGDKIDIFPTMEDDLR